MTEFEFMVQKNKELRSCLEQLRKQCASLIDKIDKHGVETNHSINSDIFEMSQKVFKISAVLGYINSFNLTLDNIKKETK